ncbi:RNHCP domain-containing protein [Candidatus Peregrinibacteria bacterium]|nr:RNHCP domain-containing protein [Candidatus Peregrinibacteria bacterium]
MHNESFVCEHCGKPNPPLKAGCRNHCRFCLYSKHVDHDIPGDRNSDCGGLMKPESLDQSGKKGYIIIHTCSICGKTIRNKCAPDDSIDAMITVSKPH